jgi:hypothetical protein
MKPKQKTKTSTKQAHSLHELNYERISNSVELKNSNQSTK